MDNDMAIYALIGICLLFILFFVFAKPMKLVGKALINSVLGLFGLIGMNFILSPFSVYVGVNVLTLIIVGILGLPGFVCLYLSMLLL